MRRNSQKFSSVANKKAEHEKCSTMFAIGGDKGSAKDYLKLSNDKVRLKRL